MKRVGLVVGVRGRRRRGAPRLSPGGADNQNCHGILRGNVFSAGPCIRRPRVARVAPCAALQMQSKQNRGGTLIPLAVGFGSRGVAP